MFVSLFFSFGIKSEVTSVYIFVETRVTILVVHA